MKAWQRQMQEEHDAWVDGLETSRRIATQRRIENETATLIQRIRAGNPNNPKTRRRMRALDRLTGQKVLTVENWSVVGGEGIYIWRIEFSDGQTRTGHRFSKTAAESDVRRVIQDMTGVSQ